MSVRSLAIRSARATAGALLFLAMLVALFRPSAAAFFCPSCYGLKPADDGVLIEASSSSAEADALAAAVAEAARRVGAFYGDFGKRPVLLACATKSCGERLGDEAAEAPADGSVFMRVSSSDADATLLAREFAHVVFYDRLRPFDLSKDDIPAWFDHGLAMIVARDPRGLDFSDPTRPRCVAEPEGALPEAREDWVREARARRDELEAMAACRTLRAIGGDVSIEALYATLTSLATSGPRQGSALE